MARQVARYVLPELPDYDRICVPVMVPNNREHIAAFIGQLAALGNSRVWGRDSAHSALLMADTWRGIFDHVSEQFRLGEISATCGDVVNCDEVALCPPAIRTGINGLQWHNPTTGNWEDLPNSQGDPRVDGTVTPPWSHPPAGQTGNCLAAANITAVFKKANDITIAQLALEEGILGIMDSLAFMLGLAIPPVGIVIDALLAYGTAAITLGLIEMTAAFTPTVYDTIRCILMCNIQADGTISLAEFLNIKSAAGTQLGSAANGIFSKWVDTYGKNGLMKQENLAGITAYDCSGCECGWCYEWDFRDGQHGWMPGSIYGGDAMQYILGTGFSSADVAGNPMCSIVFDAPVTFTDARVYCTFTGAEGNIYYMQLLIPSSNTNIMFITPFTHAVPQADSPHGTYTVDSLSVVMAAAPGGQGIVQKVQLRGTGANPFGADNCTS